ncbi:FadR/GntR family transcriptional regulator [Microbaculum sp. FT89]|uniref:FadR/GntR family transcriptional regulator n=1 Tax=Microbaculum sp. FT89 TaxID=3447298 RepID=UPI003F52CEDE
MDEQKTEWRPRPALGRDDLLSQWRAAMRDGHLPPGTRLPTERDLATASGLSRSTVRAALATLEHEGAVVRSVGRGTFIAEGAPRADTPIQQPEGPQWSPAQLMEFRLFVEPCLVDLIVLSASEADFESLARSMEEGRLVRDWQHAETADRSFHEALFRITGNAIFADLGKRISAMRDGPVWMRLKESSFSLEKWTIYQREHEGIFAALSGRNADTARNALRRHLGGVRAQTQLAHHDI